jgi:hypothetical protein
MTHDLHQAANARLIRAVPLFLALALCTTLLIAATDDGLGLCTTDGDCALLCPADDPACDGGPESAP